MTNEKKFFHYRNAFKSDHLASADVEELQENNNGLAILTLSKVEYFENRKVAGRTVKKGLVAFFKEKNTKPMIVNSGNSKILAKFIESSNVHDWSDINIRISLYVDPNVKMSGQVVGGIKVRPTMPATEAENKPGIGTIEETLVWLKEHKNNTIDLLKKHRTVTPEQEIELKNRLNTPKK